jgi:hypothetical protein
VTSAELEELRDKYGAVTDIAALLDETDRLRKVEESGLGQSIARTKKLEAQEAEMARLHMRLNQFRRALGPYVEAIEAYRARGGFWVAGIDPNHHREAWVLMLQYGDEE